MHWNDDHSVKCSVPGWHERRGCAFSSDFQTIFKPTMDIRRFSLFFRRLRSFLDFLRFSSIEFHWIFQHLKIILHLFSRFFGDFRNFYCFFEGLISVYQFYFDFLRFFSIFFEISWFLEDFLDFLRHFLCIFLYFPPISLSLTHSTRRMPLRTPSKSSKANSFASIPART